MKRKVSKTWKRAKKVVSRMGKDLNRSPLARATRGQRTKGFI